MMVNDDMNNYQTRELNILTKLHKDVIKIIRHRDLIPSKME